MFPSRPPRMLLWLALTLALMVAALFLQATAPGNLLSVTLYKGHLLALGGWGGYWLDRALFPYDRPHQYLELDEPDADEAQDIAQAELVAGNAFGHSMLRRAVIVAACLITVGLGA